MVKFLLNAVIFCFVANITNSQHILFLGCDGLGEIYLNNATQFLPNIRKLVDNGSSMIHMRNYHIEVSAPNWGTHFTGQSPDQSGIMGNDWVPSYDDPTSTTNGIYPISGKGKIPETVWRVVKQQNSNLTTAVSFTWDWIHYLIENETVDYSYRGHGDDLNTTTAMANFIINHKPNLMIVHWSAIDEAGHTHGWGSWQYYLSVRKIDNHIGFLISCLQKADIFEDTTIILTSDHGGYRKEHGQFNEANKFIPSIWSGAGVKNGYNSSIPSTNKDVAPTMLKFLGLKKGKYMDGRILSEILK